MNRKNPQRSLSIVQLGFPKFSFHNVNPIVLFLLYFCSSSATIAQITTKEALLVAPYNKVSNTSVLCLNSFLSANKNSISPSSARVFSFMNDIHPAIYISSKGIEIYGDSPTCLFIDSKLINTTFYSNLEIKNIEFITIKINSLSDLNTTIDLTVFEPFPKLKYLYLIASIACNENDIIKLLKNKNRNLNHQIIYTILKVS